MRFLNNPGKPRMGGNAVKRDHFIFGLEAEYLLVSASDYRPLFYRDVSFSELNQNLEAISLDGLPSCEGLKLESPHRKRMPYVVEGYGVVDAEFNTIDLLPKGIEIRTPQTKSIDHCLADLSTLHSRLQSQLATANLQAVSLSHHPTESQFEGPLNKRRYDWWQWAMRVMTTYGPDINIGLPSELNSRLVAKDLEAKVNYYTPALVALSAASPFGNGGLWKVRGKVGKSLRTYRRSPFGPAIELHPNQNGRLEFKSFEMTWRIDDFHNYFLLWLTLLLDDQLPGRASEQTRVYDLGQVARFGIQAETVRERAAVVLERASQVTRAWGFRNETLQILESRWEAQRCPADELIDWWEVEKGIPGVLKRLTQIESSLWSNDLVGTQMSGIPSRNRPHEQ